MSRTDVLQGADELLSAFNVATFKNAEDDKAFWNRLIPVSVEAPDEAEIKEVRTSPERVVSFVHPLSGG